MAVPRAVRAALTFPHGWGASEMSGERLAARSGKGGKYTQKNDVKKEQAGSRKRGQKTTGRPFFGQACIWRF
jgi:hypothetical protein